MRTKSALLIACLLVLAGASTSAAQTMPREEDFPVSQQTVQRPESTKSEKISNSDRYRDDVDFPPRRLSDQDQQKDKISDLVRPFEAQRATEFQEYIYASTGEKLPMFGASLFGPVPSTFAPVDRVPVTADYVIGPGDEILLRGWGQVDVDYRALVDRLGNIFIPKVGSISVSGLKFGQLQPYLKSQIGRVFKNFELNVTLGQLRSVQIFIVGHARRPGSYTVSSLSTLVNALFASGGPSNKGSMRRIQLKRGSTIVTEFDMYDLLLGGDKSKDMALLPGDVIYIPPVGQQIAVLGSVNVPAIYEIKAETRLSDALSYAGGLTPTANGGKVAVERIVERANRMVEEFDISVAASTIVKDGDLITVRSLPAQFDRSVTIRGNVSNPGKYPWRPGMKVKDLIPNREALITREYWNTQSELAKADFRTGRGESSSQKKSKETTFADDEELAMEEEDARDRGRQRTSDADRKLDPKHQDEDNAESIKQRRKKDKAGDAGQMKLRNEIKRTAPDINWDYAVIQRFNRNDLTTSLVPFNLGQAVDNANDPSNRTLEPGDVITIFSQADIKVPIAKQSKFIRLEGEFAVAGVYEVRPGETLHSLIQRAGGFTQSAYLYGAEFTRESARKDQQLRLDEFIEQLERDVERTASRTSQNVASAEEAAGLTARIESQRNLVRKLRSVEATGRVVLGIKPSDTSVAALPDFLLEDGDRLVLPYRPATVNVIGAVYNNNSFLHQTNKSAGFYIRRAGGGTRQADKGHIFVVKADGSVASRSWGTGWFGSSFESMRLMPGDTVVIPEHLDKVSLLKGLKDWSQVIAQFALGAAAIKTLTRP